jgi:hypothetical protein
MPLISAISIIPPNDSAPLLGLSYLPTRYAYYNNNL